MNSQLPSIAGCAVALVGAGAWGGWLLAGRCRRETRPAEIVLQPAETADSASSLTQAALLEDEINSLIYSVSHDVRAPLRSIDGFSRALDEDYGEMLDATAHGYINRVRANVQRINGYIEHLVSLSRLGRAEMRPERVDVSAVAMGICERLAKNYSGRNVAWSVQPGISAQADLGLLADVLDRLLENAWKFTGGRDRAVVDFTAQPQGRETVYAIRDNGDGFDMAFARKLFGAFQRLHPPEEFPGDGVGLAAARRIVHRHGGRIWAEAKRGEGATFFFTLGPANEQIVNGVR